MSKDDPISSTVAALAAAGVLATAPFSGMADRNLEIADPALSSSISFLSSSNEALTELGKGIKESEEYLEETDIRQETATSLGADQPSWMFPATELETSIQDQLASSWDENVDESDMGGGLT